MGRMHLVGGEKGGVGRSVVARLLGQFWIDRAIPWAGFDSDRSHGSFLRSYADYVSPVEVGRDADLDWMVEALEEGVEEVVVDLAAQSEAALHRWLASGRVIEFLGQLHHTLWYWYVIDHTRDSVLLLESFLDRLDAERAGAGARDAIRFVCVLNHGRARDFRLFEEHKLRNRIEQAGGVVLEIPELHPDSMAMMDAGDMSFWAAIHNADPTQGACLSLMQRQRAKLFIRQVHASFRELLFGAAPFVGDPESPPAR